MNSFKQTFFTFNHPRNLSITAYNLSRKPKTISEIYKNEEDRKSNLFSCVWTLSSIKNNYFLFKVRSEICSRINETILFQ